MVRVEFVLESWKSVRQATIEAVREFPPGEMDFRPVPDTMSFREATRHILEAGDGLAALLLTGDDNLATPDFRQRLTQLMRTVPDGAGEDELVQALQESIDRRTAELAAQTPEFWAGMITRMDGVRTTRLEMLQTIKEHEMTHRQHMFFCLRLKGLVPSTTRRRLTRQAAR